MGLYAIPEKGFVSLWPYVDLGDDKAIALYYAGCRKDKLPTAAYGYAVVIPDITKDGVRANATRLRSGWLPYARAEAIALAQGRPATLMKAVGRGLVTVWERVESIQAMTDAQAESIVLAKEIRKDGELVEKMNPRNGNALSLFTNNLATTVTHDLSKKMRRPLRKYVEDLVRLSGRGFEDLSEKQFHRIWKEASDVLAIGVKKGYGLAAPQVTQKIKVAVKDMSEKNARFLQSTYLPKISGSFSQRDYQAIEQIGSQGGFWIRDSAGKISEQVSNKGRDIIQDGLKNGQGRDEIAKSLTDKLPEMWGAMGFNYARVVAANAVSRARSYSEVASYASVGITYLEVVAMLDERTTDICRTLDGSIIEVQPALEHQRQIAGLKNPEDVRTVAPFLREKTDKATGEKHINIGQTRFATISRSGKGKVDDRGSFSRNVGNKAMIGKGVSMPPFHHNCRSMTVARVEMTQVPKNYEPNTTPVAATNDEILPKKPVESKQVPQQQQRPVVMSPIPTQKKPVYTGQKKTYDPPIKKNPGMPPKEAPQLPNKEGPQNLKQYNLAVKNEIEAAYGKKAKIIDVKFVPGVGALKYTFANPDFGGAPTSWHMKIPPSQSKKMAAAMAARDKRNEKKILLAQAKKKPVAGKHAYGNMARSKISSQDADVQLIQNARHVDSMTRAERNLRNTRIQRALLKDPDFQTFSRETHMTPSNFTSKIRSKWEDTSRDHSWDMHYYQMAVQQEFNLPKETLSVLDKEIVGQLKASSTYERDMKAYRALVRAQYKETQKQLKERGIKKVTLFRGYSLRTMENSPKGATFTGRLEDVAVTTQPISSYSLKPKMAHEFASGNDYRVMIKQEVPASRIFGNWQAGIGTDFEAEFVVLGGKDDFAESVNWAVHRQSISRHEATLKIFGDK